MSVDRTPDLPFTLKVQLTEDWYACTPTTAVLYFAQFGQAVLTQQGYPDQDPSQWQSTPYPIPLDDPSGLITWDAGAFADENDDFYIPNGFICLVQRPQDAFDGHYELVHVGEACPGSGSEGSGSEEEGSGSTICNHNPHPNPDAPTIIPTRVWGQDANDCYGWAQVAQCVPEGSGSGI